jgi:alkanesulfonate monooxygenase SsuD/methylene tetrahydromethanopterin reductase-like flavin-dependent oxidoreductase (luciferase family)
METAEFAASHHLGLGISYEPFDFAAEQSRHYFEQCAGHGWTPNADAIVYRGRIVVAESTAESVKLYEAPGGNARPRTVSETTHYIERIESTRRSLAHIGKGPVWNFIGTPDEIVVQLREARDVAGIGVVDLAFDPPPGDEYREPLALQKKIMRSVELFGREVLPAMREI